MRKNKPMRLAAVLLVLMLLTVCFVGGTIAKYTSSANGTATATTAKWSITVGETDIATTQTFDVSSLLTTISEINGGTEDHASKIAPGTEGTIEFTVTNASEVDATITAAIENTGNNSVPLTYSISVKDGTDTSADVEEGKSVTFVVKWSWPWSEEVENAYAAQTVSAKVTVTATQIN